MGKRRLVERGFESPHPPQVVIAFLAKAVGSGAAALLLQKRSYLLTDGLEDDVQEAVKQFAQGDHSEDQRRHGRERDYGELQQCILAERYRLHALHDFKAVAQISQRLDVPAAHQRFVGRRSTAQPFLVKLAHVTLGEPAVFQQADALGASQTRSEHQQRREHEEKHHYHQREEFNLEVGQLRAGVEDLVRHHAGEQHALARQQRSEGVGDAWKESRGRRRGRGE